MAARKSPSVAAGKAPANVDAFLDALAHPCDAMIRALRQTILATDRTIAEEVKWNAPSFRTTEHFATMQLRSRNTVMLVLHRGARKSAAPPVKVPDPAGLLTWLGPDRATVTFADVKDVEARGPALQTLLRAWLKQV